MSNIISVTKCPNRSESFVSHKLKYEAVYMHMIDLAPPSQTHFINLFITKCFRLQQYIDGLSMKTWRFHQDLANDTR